MWKKLRKAQNITRYIIIMFFLVTSVIYFILSGVGGDLLRWVAGIIEDAPPSYFEEKGWTDELSPKYICKMMGVSIGALLCAVIVFVRVFTAKPRAVYRYLRQNPQITEEMLEEDFRMATEFNASVWVGQEHTYIVNGLRVKIIKNRDIVWAYYRTEKPIETFFRRIGLLLTSIFSLFTNLFVVFGSEFGRKSELRYFCIDKKKGVLKIPQQCAIGILSIYAKNQPHMIIGYSKGLKKLYKKDLPAFLNQQYNEACRQYAVQGTEQYVPPMASSDWRRSYEERW